MKKIGALFLVWTLLLGAFARPLPAQNVYTPAPGAIRVFHGDYIGVDMTGCGGSANGIVLTYRFFPAGQPRPLDFSSLLQPPTGACPAGQAFTNAQIPLDDGWLYAVGILGNSVGMQQAAMWTQVFVGRGMGNLVPTVGGTGTPITSINQYPHYIISCAPALFQQCSWTLGSTTGNLAQDTTLLGQNLGVNQNQTVTNPAAGANFSTTLTNTTNNNFLYNVVNIRFTLVTSAAAGNRFACVQFQAPAAGPIFLSSCSVSAQVPSSTVSYNFSIATGPSPLITIVAGANNPDISCSLPSLVQIHDASTIASNVVGIQAADQLSNIVIRSQFANYMD